MKEELKIAEVRYFYELAIQQLARQGGVLMIMHDIVVRPLTSHPYKAGTGHAGFSPDQARTQSPSAKRRGVFGESHEG